MMREVNSGLNILICGYGRMGRAVETVAVERGHTIVGHIGRGESVGEECWRAADMAIEFTHPQSAADQIAACAERGLPVVSGTTGWNDALALQQEASAEAGHKFLWAPNFSIGVYAMMKAVAAASAVLVRDPDYKARLQEVHHKEKKDSPSGTALAIAAKVQQQAPGLDVPITALRKEGVFGNHDLEFVGACDTLRIAHNSTSRTGFATGAVLAAEWLAAYQGPVNRAFSMDDFFTS
ncbi:MAG: dihydrodipicolinate reductase C-terminal domain-containing protein [Flavobacteriales bacterium]|nr:dihydrodipicolinate reductase C-terminal domain-containing protein [Flavobacteriales bacterium]